MPGRIAKTALNGEFAALGRALANPARLEILELLAQGPRSVHELAVAADLGITTCSAHLHTLRSAGLVGSHREGKRVVNHLTGDDVAQLVVDLHAVALRHRAAAGPASRNYLGPDDPMAVGRDELLRRARTGDVLVLDVRPEAEYAWGHLPGAISIPLDELVTRLDELPKDTEVVAYCRGAFCVMSHEAVRILNTRGYRARRTDEGVLEWRGAGLLPPIAA